MEALVASAGALLPLLYGGCALLYARIFANEDDPVRRLATPALLAVFLLHWGTILSRAWVLGYHPMVGAGPILSVIAIGIVSAYLYVERMEHQKATGVFILGVVVLLEIISVSFGGGHPGAATGLAAHPLFGIHIVVAVGGYAAFALGAVYGSMYLALFRRLKSQQYDLFFRRMPPLDVLANMGFWAGVLGWMALTVTIILGIVMSLSLPEVPQIWSDPQFVATLVVWGIYAVAIVARVILGWRGTRSAYLSVVGFCVAMITFMAKQLLWDTFHSFLA